jgi:type I restriction enzyme S subunit
MTTPRLLNQFERITDSVDSVPNLRRLILDLAVRGKLGTQDSHDTPASELMDQIRKVGADFRRGDGRARRRQPEPLGLVKTQPFPLPRDWVWVRFGAVAEFSAGRTPPRQDSSFWGTGAYPWVSIADMPDAGVVIETRETVSEEARQRIFRANPCPPGTLIMSFKLTIGKIARLGVPAFHNEAIIAIRPYLREIEGYLFKVLPLFARQGDTKDAIKGATLNRDSLFNIALPLPPLAEQHRIVSRVDELMSLCDHLEDAREERERRRDRLVAASLRRLGTTTDSEALRSAARFHMRNLAQLVTRPEHVCLLRDCLLNVAIRGQLVQQDPEDEPATTLLARIQTERADMLRGRRREFEAPVEPIDEPHAIPDSWVWTRLGAVGDWGSGSTPPRSNRDFFGGGVTWLKSGELNDDQHLSGSEETVTELALSRGSFRRNQPGDVLIAMYGATIGKLAILAEPAVTNQAVCGCTPVSQVSNRYLFLFLLSQRAQFRSASEGGAQPNISKAKIVRYPFALPPIAEQRRIVAKVDELFGLLAELQSRLETDNAGRRALLEALFSQALAEAA